jgi:signal transduction histidine kinase
MNHEVRTPLNTITGYCDVIEDRLVEIGDAELLEAANCIRNGSDRLVNTLQAVFDVSLLESRSFEVRPQQIDLPLSVNQCVETARAAASKRGLSLVCKIDEFDVTATKLFFDRYSFERATSAILDNAIKFTERGGIVVRLFTNKESKVCLEVQDTGIGISAEYLPKLYQPFSQEEQGFSRSHEGNGLGLAIAKRLLEINGATISAQSEKGLGSTFTIELSRR